MTFQPTRPYILEAKAKGPSLPGPIRKIVTLGIAKNGGGRTDGQEIGMCHQGLCSLGNIMVIRPGDKGHDRRSHRGAKAHTSDEHPSPHGEIGRPCSKARGIPSSASTHQLGRDFWGQGHQSWRTITFVVSPPNSDQAAFRAGTGAHGCPSRNLQTVMTGVRTDCHP